MNLPNLLTIIRFLLIPVYLIFFFSELPNHMFWALGIILFAGLTDVLDGYLARRNKQVTQIGKMLDPLADKSMMIAIFLSLFISGKISLLAATAIFVRDLAMILCGAFFHFSGKKTVSANIFGKLTTFLFYVALFMLLFNFSIAKEFLWTVIIVSYITSLIYMLQLKVVNKQ